MNSPLFRKLLVFAEQPKYVRECHDLVARLVATVRVPTYPQVLAELGTLTTVPDQAARLGYLLDALAHVAPLQFDASWAPVLQHLKSDRGAPGARWALFGCEESVNELDDLARCWGLHRGIPLPALRHIIRTSSG